MTGLYINHKSYDFTDDNGKHIAGNSINFLVGDDIVKVTATDEQLDYLMDNGCEFGTEIPLDVRVKGKYAKYILAK